LHAEKFGGVFGRWFPALAQVGSQNRKPDPVSVHCLLVSLVAL